MQYPTSIPPTQDIKNTKFAAVALVLGLKLQKPGIYITLDRDHPEKSTGGQAHFLFETDLANSVHNYLQIYETGTADAALDDYLSSMDLPEAARAELEKKISEALIVYGRKFLDQYQIAVRYVKEECNRFLQTGGEPVYVNGQVVGVQNFKLTQLRKPKK